jgi:dephospho-CoA kinase
MSENVPVLVISGSMGSGKTTVLSEASDLLSEAQIAHAAIDLDWLSVGYPTQEDYGQALINANLTAIWPNYVTAGAQRLLIARVVEDRSELQGYKHAVSGAEIVVCCLSAPIVTMQGRLRIREPGMFQAQAIARCAELAHILERSGAEDFIVDNSNGRLITEVAREVLSRADWL